MKKDDPRIENIFKAIQNIASGNFSTHIEISDALDEIDGIATGINMLSEEVQMRITNQAKENEKLSRTIDQLKELDTSEVETIGQPLIKKGGPLWLLRSLNNLTF